MASGTAMREGHLEGNGLIQVPRQQRGEVVKQAAGGGPLVGGKGPSTADVARAVVLAGHAMRGSGRKAGAPPPRNQTSQGLTYTCEHMGFTSQKLKG